MITIDINLTLLLDDKPVRGESLSNAETKLVRVIGTTGAVHPVLHISPVSGSMEVGTAGNNSGQDGAGHGCTTDGKEAVVPVGAAIRPARVTGGSSPCADTWSLVIVESSVVGEGGHVVIDITSSNSE